jgi:hypothetical protein
MYKQGNGLGSETNIFTCAQHSIFKGMAEVLPFNFETLISNRAKVNQ